MKGALGPRRRRSPTALLDVLRSSRTAPLNLGASQPVAGERQEGELFADELLAQEASNGQEAIEKPSRLGKRRALHPVIPGEIPVAIAVGKGHWSVSAGVFDDVARLGH